MMKLATILIGVLFSLQSARAADTFQDCETCPEMVVIPAGQFLMGSDRYPSERPVSNVTIVQDYAIGRFEVTFDEWKSCITQNGCQAKRARVDPGWGKGQHPAVVVSRNDTQAFVAWLNTKVEGTPYHLPSEAEWEYAARGGNRQTTLYSWGDQINCSMANYGGLKGTGCYQAHDNKLAGTKEVGSYAPNGYGLYDMHGNVWEWVEDCWHPNYIGRPAGINQFGTAWIEVDKCAFYVFRGGSWSDAADRLRSASRSRLPIASREFNFGFRVAKSLSDNGSGSP